MASQPLEPTLRLGVVLKAVVGQRAEARRWLDRLREHRPSEDPARFWDELEVRLLRGEAEAVILYDPVFPDDPFAH